MSFACKMPAGRTRFGAPSIADPPPSSRASASSPCLRWANTLYVGTHGGHFAVYNVTNPGAAVLVGMVDVSDPVWDIALIGTNAVVALGRAGIGLVDVSVPNPSVLIPGSGITNDWATRVRTVGNRVYSNRGTALRVRDLTGALTFANVATVDAGDWVTDIAVDGARCVVATESRGLVTGDRRWPARKGASPGNEPLRFIRTLKSASARARFSGLIPTAFISDRRAPSRGGRLR